MEVTWAFVLKDRYANSMVRVLRFDYKEIERDFRVLFKDENVQFHKRIEEASYHYEFPGHNLVMTVELYVLHNMD